MILLKKTFINFPIPKLFLFNDQKTIQILLNHTFLLTKHKAASHIGFLPPVTLGYIQYTIQLLYM